MLSVNAFTLGATLVLILLNFFNVRNYGEAEFWFDQGRGHRLLHRRRHAGRAAAALGRGPGVVARAHGGFMPNGGRRWWWRCWG